MFLIFCDIRIALDVLYVFIVRFESLSRLSLCVSASVSVFLCTCVHTYVMMMMIEEHSRLPCPKAMDAHGAYWDRHFAGLR